MDYTHALVLCSAAMSVFGGSVYIRDMFRGTTKPNKVTWFLWATAPLIGVGAAYSAGADLWALVRIFLAGFIPLIVLIASFFLPRAAWKLTTFDFLCGAASIVALILWLILNNPVMAILFAVTADAFAAIPTIVKSYYAPESESVSSYIASFVSVLLVIPAIPVWDIPNSAFQVYLLGVSLIIIVLILRPQAKSMLNKQF